MSGRRLAVVSAVSKGVIPHPKGTRPEGAGVGKGHVVSCYTTMS
jgi:hypothetical protein